ncbi:MAG: hypothetical protein AB1540_06490 [Bdellovibrionota bacterium]
MSWCAQAQTQIQIDTHAAEIKISSHHFKIGQRRVLVEEGTENGVPYFKVEYDRYEKWKYWIWGRSRGDSSCPEAGSCKAWDIDDLDRASQYWLETDELKVGGRFTMKLSPNESRDWQKLAIIDDDVLLVLEDKLNLFFQNNLAALKELAQAMETKLKENGFSYNFEHPLRRGFFQVRRILENGGNWGGIKNPLLKEKFLKAYRANDIPLPINELRYFDRPIKTHPLIVVHASSMWDGTESAKPSIDALVRKFKAAKKPVIYLVSDDSMQDFSWYTEDRNPTFAVYSERGEHMLEFLKSEVTVVGGFSLQGCQGRAMTSIVHNYFKRNTKPLTLHLPLRAIYSAKVNFTEESPRLEAPVNDYETRTMTLFEILQGFRFFGGTKGFLDFYRGVEFYKDKTYRDPVPLSDKLYFGNDKVWSRITGAVTTEGYQFHFLLDGRPIGDPLGSGNRSVKLNFITEDY